MPSIRVVEVLAALSLTSDLTAGTPFEEGMATCVAATRFAETLELSEEDRAAVFYATLLRAIGCAGHASENAGFFDDDIAFQAALRVLDPGDPAVFAAQLEQFGRWSGVERGRVLSQRFREIAAVEGPVAAQAGCETSRVLGSRLSLPPAAIDALDEVHERWDGLGIPAGRRGDELTVAARILHVAEQAMRAHAGSGIAGAVAEVRRRAGGHLDPELVAQFVPVADGVFAAVEDADLLAAVLELEPQPRIAVSGAELDRLCLALSVVPDLKGRYLLGHSAHVGVLADAGAGLLGYDDAARAEVRAAALLHDLGRTGVPSSVWDRAGELSAGDWERIRLHPYWTERILRRCPALAGLADIAGAHHERLDGSGYHRGVRAADQPRAARLLAAADAFATATEQRPHRPRCTDDEAARRLSDHAAAGRLDRDSVAAVIEAAGQPSLRTEWPNHLTDREVDVLRLAARGLSNRAIADALSVSDRTVGHHLAHVYDKIERRTRAGAAVFAIEHGLLPE